MSLPDSKRFEIVNRWANGNERVELSRLGAAIGVSYAKIQTAIRRNELSSLIPLPLQKDRRKMYVCVGDIVRKAPDSLISKLDGAALVHAPLGRRG